MPPPKLKVFWDLDSCGPPSYSTPWDVIDSVRLFTSNFGVVTDIRAYWDSNKNATVDPASESLRAAMPSMGVNIVDCSLTQGYTEDVVTRRLTVDVLISAMDESVSTDTYAQDIIVVLSGDESILYPISLLMFRNYTIFLVVPDDDSNVQPSQATRIFNWQRDVLGTRVEESPHIPEDIVAPEAIVATEAIVAPEAIVASEAIVAPETPPPAATVPNRAWVVFGKRVPQRSVALDSTPVTTPRSGSRSVTSPGPPLSPHAPSGLSSNSTKINAMDLRPSNTEDTRASTDARYAMAPPMSEQSEPEQPTQRDSHVEKDSHVGWNTIGQWVAGDWNVDPERESRKNHHLEGSFDEMGIYTEYPFQLPQEVPLSVFDPLLRILREAKRRSMVRSRLGEEMTRYKSVYKEAGVRNFHEYISLAVKRELVVAGGIENNQYVRLHPKIKRT